ncbi:MAG TPA: hypothetical protein VEB18_02905 [Candidatus Paceibacterota bacterium]|nr:hypothetical protein [Candidatus Paceibacterota bacterium]
MSLGALASYFVFQLLIPLIFTVIVVTFIWGVFLHFTAGADGELGEKGKVFMVWGLVALVIIFLLWWALRSLADVTL